MPNYKTLTGQIKDLGCTCYVEMRGQSSTPASVCNVLYFNLEFPKTNDVGITKAELYPLCVCEDIRYPSPFKTIKKFVHIAYKYNQWVTVMIDTTRNIFILKSDGKHHDTQVCVSVVLHKGNPYQRMQNPLITFNSKTKLQHPKNKVLPSLIPKKLN